MQTESACPENPAKTLHNIHINMAMGKSELTMVRMERNNSKKHDDVLIFLFRSGNIHKTTVFRLCTFTLDVQHKILYIQP